jgi:flavin-dependent dehydrogenase
MNTSNRNEVADIVIVGAGVAGSAVALACAGTIPNIVLLHFGNDRKGTESLSPDACKRLKAFSIEVGVPLSSVYAWWGSNQILSSPCPGARIVQRDELAKEIRTRAKKSAAIVQCKSIIALTRNGGNWLISYRDLEGKVREIKARNVCDATGRRSTVGRNLGSMRIARDSLCCAAVSITGFKKVGTWTEAVSNGWWNLCSDGECATLAFYSTPRSLRTAVRDLMGLLAETNEMQRLVAFDGQARAFVHVCGSSLLTPCAGPNWLAVGDAAMTLQPLASAGIAKALRDSQLAVNAIGSDGQDFNRRCEMEFDDYSAILLKHYGLETRWPSSDFWTLFRRPRLGGEALPFSDS